MPMTILKNVHDSPDFRVSPPNRIRSTCDTDQLRAQREALKFSVDGYKSQLDGLSRELAEARLEIALVGCRSSKTNATAWPSGRVSRELAEARLEIARQNAVDVLAGAPSPSASKH